MVEVGSFPGASATTVRAISGEGSVVVGKAEDGSMLELFRWSADQGFSSLGKFPSTNSEAFGVNRDGRFIVGSAPIVSGNINQRAFRWDATGGFIDLGTLGGTGSAAYGISNDGAVVVGMAATAIDQHAFRWEAGNMLDLGTLATGERSAAQGVSGDGSVVVGFSGSKAFRWDATTKMVDLGTLGGLFSSANATNGDGTVVIGFSELADRASLHAYRWTASGGMQDLGTLAGGRHSYGHDVSADGSVVVGSAVTLANNSHAFRWTAATGMTDLGTLTGETNSDATAVSDDGNTVVGNSGERAFIWKGAAGIQDLARLQTSQITSAKTLGYLTASQNRRVRNLNQPQCIPGVAQQYCLSVGASAYNGEGPNNGIQKIGQIAAGLRIDDEFSVGANSSMANAELRSQSAKQTHGFGLSLWAAYQQSPNNLGWTGTVSAGMDHSDNTFERGAGLTDVQRARATTNLNSTGLRAAVGYGLNIDATAVTPEIALSHVRTHHDGFTEHNVAFPLTVEGGGSSETYATFGIRSATPFGTKATLNLGVALDVLLNDDTDAIKGHSQVPGLNRFKLDSTLDKRAVVPVAMAGYSYALDANSTIGAHVQVGAGTYEQQHTVFGLGVQYKYAL